MPNTTEGILLAIAALFLMIGLIGGGFEISAAKIPPVGKKGRIGAGIVGLLLLALAIRSIASHEAPTKVPTPVPTATRANEESHGASTSAVTELKLRRAPIDNLFKAWERRDLDAYLDQWHARGKQWVGATSRSMSQIAERRQADFEKYQRVQVIDYTVDIDNTSTDPVIARVTYSMRFQKRDGTWVSESNRRETYKLTFLKDRDRWVILENFDYVLQ